jgi:hypothetical protein
MIFSNHHGNEQQQSDFVLDQYPAYLTPDGTWFFGGNAKKIADVMNPSTRHSPDD